MGWFKLHDEFLTDPKMLRYFTKAERCDWVGILCIANKSRERGAILLPDDEIAYALDLSDAKWGAFADKLIQRRMVDRRDDGSYIILQWEDRQHVKPSDSPEAAAERKRQQREREKLARDIEENESVTTSHAPVTRDSVTCHAEEEENKNKTRVEETRREEIYIQKEREAQNVAPSPPPAEEAPSRARHGKRAHTLPENFTVSDSMKAWAGKDAPRTDLQSETEKFRDYHNARGSVMKDWEAAWRTWIRNAVTFAAKNGNGQGPGPSSSAAPNTTKPYVPPAQRAEAEYEAEKRARAERIAERDRQAASRTIVAPAVRTAN